MRRTPFAAVLLSLSGCFYISNDEADERLAWLDTGGDAPFALNEFGPLVVSACEDPAVFTVEGEVDGAFGGAEFTTLAGWDGEPFVGVGTAVADAAFAGRARLAFDFAPSLPEPLATCTDDVCDHTLVIGLGGPADLEVAVPDTIRVVAPAEPAAAEVALLDASDAATPLAEATPAATPAGAFRTADWPAIAVGLTLPLAAAGGEADWAVEVWACPDGVDPATDDGACLVAEATADGAAVAGDRVFVAPTSGFGAAGCADSAPRSLYARVLGDPCAAEAFVALGEARFAADDCDGDAVLPPLDCDDEDATTNPSGVEVCGLADEDCDGLVDEDDPSLVADTWYEDVDKDGTGDADTATVGCEPPPGFVADGTDCDDGDAALGGPTPWYDDGDGDGLGDPASATSACVAPLGTVANDGDCDDGDGAVGGPVPFWKDGDGDALGDAQSTVDACDAPTGYVANDDDCDDADDTVGVGDTFYEDADADGFGDDASTLVACAPPATGDWLDVGGDCEPFDPFAYPGAPEVCLVSEMAQGTDVDNDCSGKDDADDCGTCTDGKTSRLIDETDKDCGGQCAMGCGFGLACDTDADCGSGACNTSGFCVTWNRSWQGSGVDDHAQIAVAPDGALYVAASVLGTADAGGGADTDTGHYDLYLARYAQDGTFEWGRRIGTGASAERLGDLTVGANGDAILVGDIDGPGLLEGTLIGAVAGATDVVVVRVTQDGLTRWAKVVPGPGDESARAVIVDAADDLVIGGVADDDGFVAWLAGADGAAVGTPTTFAGNQTTGVASLALHPSGDVLVGGFYGEGGGPLATASVTVTPGGRTQTAPISGTGRDGFAARLDASTRAATWLVAVQGASSQTVVAIAAEPSGDVWVGGHTFGPATIAGGPARGNGDTARSDAFLARLGGASGAHVWSSAWGAASANEVVTGLGQVRDRVVAAYAYEADHDANPGSGTLNVKAAGGTDLALSAFDAVGTLGQGVWLAGASWPDPGDVGVRLGGTPAYDLAVNGALGAVVVATSADGFLDLQAGRVTDSADAPGARGVLFGSLGPSGWPSSTPRDGYDALRAARSCRALHDDYPLLPSGSYTIDPNGGAAADAVRVYCEMTLDGGGWTRVYTNRGTVVCGMGAAYGNAADIANGGPNTAWFAPSTVETLFERKDVMLVVDDTGGRNVFKSTHAGWTWTNLATGVINGWNIQNYNVTVSRNGGPFVSAPNSDPQRYYGGLLGSHDGTYRTILMGSGANARIALDDQYLQDSGCNLGSNEVGLRSGNDPATRGTNVWEWGRTGHGYVR